MVRTRWFQKMSFIVVLIVFGLLIRSLLGPMLPRTDDFELHSVRLANYALALRGGQWPPAWGPNLFYGFGYPIYIFAYHGPFLLASPWYFLGLSIERSMNVMVILSIISALMGSWLMGWHVSQNRWQATATSLWYTTGSAALMNIFVRGAAGEIVFWGFLPWMIWFVWKRQQSNTWWYQLLFAPIAAMFLLSHHVNVLFALLVLIPWWIFIEQAWKDTPLRWYWQAGIVALFSLFGWLPLVAERHNSIFDEHGSSVQYLQNFPPWQRFWWSPWGYGGFDQSEIWPATIGFVGVLVLWFTVLWLRKQLKQQSLQSKRTYAFWLLILFVSWLVMQPLSIPLWRVSPFLHLLQFPWRIIWLSNLSLIMLWLLSLNQKLWPVKWVQTITIVLILTAILRATWYAKPYGFISNPEHMWQHHPTSTTSDNEHTPRWFVLDQNLVQVEQAIIDVPGSVSVEYWDGTQMRIQVEAEKPGNVVLRTMYYPGWQATVNGEPQEINWQDETYPGRILVPVNEGSSQVLTRFTHHTWDRKLGQIALAVGLVVYTGNTAYAVITTGRSTVR